jgi:exopolysaccharide biosynthesis polyprenyl glycosylphosphotransferase
MTSNAWELALAHKVSRVIVAQQDSRGQVSMNSLLNCKTSGIPVERSSDYFERLTGRVLLDERRIKSWLIFSQGFVISKSTLAVKRAMDVLVSLVGLVVMAPVMLLVAVAVKLDSRGPVFYRQERVGRNGRPFTVWKFRSMTVDAEKAGEAQWAAKADTRVTRLGTLLRKARLDELPQLWNVINGSMSLVGPRPERRVFTDQLQLLHRLYDQRHTVRPGLTGWAQIKAPYAGSIEESIEKLSFDLYYIKNLSVFLDLSIMASTLRIVLVGRGAR